jgi:23S rRNA pseudouridine1911/1915/1917 synthase
MTERYVATAGRLDAVVAALANVTRGESQRAIADGPVRAGGEPVSVRYRDEHLLVVAKPAGVLTHPTATTREGTLVNRLLAMGVPLAPAGGPTRPGIVHRLDVGTSGVLLVASTDDAFRALQAMLRRHDVDRRYLALVRGGPDHDDFHVIAPLGRRAARIVVDHAHGRGSATRFAVRERLVGTSLVEATPETGRTHQIRVHLQGGDAAARLGLDRPFLHSSRLELTHPITGERVEVIEPLPPELERALARARADLRP